jgi:hypothetical protein
MNGPGRKAPVKMLSKTPRFSCSARPLLRRRHGGAGAIGNSFRAGYRVAPVCLAVALLPSGSARV